jgi:hypothetical protein
MALSFYDELTAFMKHHLEQDPAWHAMTTGQFARPLEPQDVLDTVSRMIGVHTQALLLVAEEIDKLRAPTNSG